MIDINKLTRKDIGKWVVYASPSRKSELGKIKSYKGKLIFVVYKCAGEWDRFKAYTGVPTRPEDLSFCEVFGYPTKADALDSSVKDIIEEEEQDWMDEYYKD